MTADTIRSGPEVKAGGSAPAGSPAGGPVTVRRRFRDASVARGVAISLARTKGYSPLDVTERILIVDDEPDLLELVRFNLSQAGFDVETATGGQEGIEKARRHRPDLVVLDLMLPDLPGRRSAAACGPTPSSGASRS